MPEWTLYGQKLDLEEFKKNHPGGELAILLGEERDCTRLFEQYHCRNASNQVVLKQIAKEQGKEIDPTITDPFQQEILQMSYDHKQYTATSSKLILLSIAGVLTVLCWIGWFYGSWLACILLPIITWLFAVNIGHDAGHFAFNNNQWINELCTLIPSPLLFNITFWYLEHNISHHTYTNELERDIDMHIGEPLVYLHTGRSPTIKSFLSVVFGGSVNLFLSSIALTITYPILMLLGDTKVTQYTGDYKAIVKYCTPKLVICFILSALFIIVPFLLFSWPKAIAFILIPYFLSSIIFINVTQVSHIQEEVQPEIVNENWMRQMVEHSMDYSQDSKLWFFLTGGLNLQSIHHCIPALDSSQLFELYPKFREICKKHGVKINEVPTFLEAVKKYWYHMYNVSTNPTKIKQPPKGEGCPYKASKVD